MSGTPSKGMTRLKWPKPVSAVLALTLLLSGTGVTLYETGQLPYKVYVVHTGSMSPTIPSESGAIVQQHQYRAGDVIAFTEHGTVITHRLVAIAPNGTIVTKGDANRTVDPWRLRRANIIGRVVAAPRRLGYLLTYVKTPEGWASIVVALMCIWQTWAIASGLASKKRVAERTA